MRDTRSLIKSLPLSPDKLIIWIVYNEDMIEYTRSQIAAVKGYDYVSKFVRVVTRSESSKYNGHIYFDPNLQDQLGCGHA